MRSGARCRGASSRIAMCSAAATGRRIDWSGRASILPVPHSRCMAIDRNVLSRTVLPTPRRPVSDHAALGAAPGHPLQHDLELLQLAVAPGELRRALAGSGGVRIAHRVHALGLYGGI